jgi:catechol 1,2-dioxygenase
MVSVVRDPASLIELKLTEAIGNIGEHSISQERQAARKERDPTEDDVIGPYYRRGAPYRAKISPPMASGEVLVISGRVWSFHSKRPIRDCLLDVWQANADGHYDNEDQAHPPAPHSFVNRARLHCTEHGYYEFETIFPGPYRMDATTWRSPHIHFLVRAIGYKTLVTQLFFEGAPYLDSDPFVKQSLIIPLRGVSAGASTFRCGIFDIVLADDVDETM